MATNPEETPAQRIASAAGCALIIIAMAVLVVALAWAFR